jgi:2-keto-3-deoxy-L-fuconate dehydrogenase
MTFSLKNKIAVVTGGGSGIGRAVALCFAEQGATVCIIELNSKSADETAQIILSGDGQASRYPCDVTKQSEVIATVQEIIHEHHRIDILVNCAGIAHIGKLETTNEADFERLFQVNVKGTYNMLYAIITQMKKQKRGVILNLASVASRVGVADRFAYSMTKGAVVGMTLSVAKDYVGEGIRCNCISPARVHTPFVDGFLKANYPGRESEMFEKLSKTQPVGRMAEPQEIAHLALYLCSDESSFVTGCDYPIDGGFINLNT